MTIQRIFLFLSACISLLLACNKEWGQSSKPRTAMINLTLDGITFDTHSFPEQTIAQFPTTPFNEYKTERIKYQSIIPYDHDLSISVELEENNSAEEFDEQSKKKLLKASQLQQRAAIERQNLETGILYRILVYKDGILQDQRDFVHGEESNTRALELDQNTDYVFIAYSVNSKTILPNPININNLNQVSLENRSEDVLWTRQNLRFGETNNNVSLSLKHVFSQIQVLISPGSYGGRVESISNAVIGKIRTGASIKLASGDLSFGSEERDQQLTFSATDVNAVSQSSGAVLLISPTINHAYLNIGNLSINGIQKPLLIPNLPIEPGKKYNLRLTFNAPCTFPDNMGSFLSTDGRTQSFFLTPENTYGLTFEFWSLTKSVGFTINGQPVLYRNIIEERFQNTGTTANPIMQWVITNTTREAYDFQFLENTQNNPAIIQNMQFKRDKARWGFNGVPNISAIPASSTNPFLRIELLQTGEVKFFGRRNQGSMEELEIITETRGPFIYNRLGPNIRFSYQAFLNPNIPWNKPGNNSIVARQVPENMESRMEGRAFTRRRVPCAVTP